MLGWVERERDLERKMKNGLFFFVFSYVLGFLLFFPRRVSERAGGVKANIR